jgi:hypothetical protein
MSWQASRIQSEEPERIASGTVLRDSFKLEVAHSPEELRTKPWCHGFDPCQSAINQLGDPRFKQGEPPSRTRTSPTACAPGGDGADVRGWSDSDWRRSGQAQAGVGIGMS